MPGKRTLTLLALGALCGNALAQGVITTIAGTDWVFNGDGKPALSAPLGRLSGITVDAAGNPIIADSGNCMFARINPDPDNTLTVIAGNGVCASNLTSSGEGGPPTSAAMYLTGSASVDARGDLYVSTVFEIRKISSGIINTLAGRPPSYGFTGDNGPARNAQINSNGGIAVDASGNVYFADGGNHRVRKITTDGIISTVAGNGAAAFSGDDGPATGASLNAPWSVALDKTGNLYIADTNNKRIRKVTLSTGVISTLVYNLTAFSIAFDDNEVMFIGGYNAVYKLPVNSTTPIRIAGSAQGLPGDSGDNGPAIDATFNGWNGQIFVAPDKSGNLYIADSENHRVRKIGTNKMISTIAGNGNFRYAGEGVRAVSAPLNFLLGLALDSGGNVYVSEDLGRRVRKISPDGILATFAGTGQQGFSGDDGPATLAKLSGPEGLLFYGGNLYIADTANHRIRKVTPAGIISTFASISLPVGLSADANGNLYVSTLDSRIIKIAPNRTVTPFAGTGVAGYSGDNGQATNAMLNSPFGLAFDMSGNLYIADRLNNRVRKVTAGVITTYAGNGEFGRSGDGFLATLAQVGRPSSLAFDRAGNLYVGQSDLNLVRKVTPSAMISRFAGGGSNGQLNDGKPATEAAIGPVEALAIDDADNLYLADAFYNRVRKVLATPQTMQVSPPNVEFSASSGGASVTRTLAVTGSVFGLEFDVTIDTGGTGDWLTVDVPVHVGADSAASTPRLLTLTADPNSLEPKTYPAKVTIRPRAALPATLTVDVTFKVGPAQDPVLRIDKPQISFTLPQGVTARTSSIVISNLGGRTLNYAATASTDSGGAWLSLSPASGQALPGKPSTLNVTADPAVLSPGTYTGQIAIQSDAGSQAVTVIVTVNSNPQAVLLTQTGMSFSAVAGGGVIPPQSFGVLNAGTGKMAWEAHASTASGGNWLLVSAETPPKFALQASGRSDAATAAPQVTVAVDASALVEGKYYGTVRIDAPSTANQSSYLTVFLSVAAKGTRVPASVQPTELVFNATPGGGPPSSQTLTLYNISAIPKTFTIGNSSGQFQLYTLPANGTLDPQRPTHVVVQPGGNFPAGTFTETLTFQFSDGTVQGVKITVISSAGSVPIPGSADKGRAAETSCEQLIVTLDTLSNAFQVAAGWPVALSVKVSDKCQNPLRAGDGSVWVQFDNGEDDVDMTALGDGTPGVASETWQGTWKPRQAKSQVKVTIHAKRGTLLAEKAVTGDLASQNDAPVFTYASITSAFAPTEPKQPTRPLAPGSLITIKPASSAQLSGQVAMAPDGEPLDTLLGQTQVFFNDTPAPLSNVNGLQIDAVVPWSVNRDTVTSVRIKRGVGTPSVTYSAPVIVDIAGAQPSVRQNNGAAVISPPGPVAAGDLITISCAGLGITNPVVADGQLGPSDARATQAKVTVTIGGKDAEVKFAGLAPGLVAVYQVDAVVPSGIEPGDSVPLTVSVVDQKSPVVTLAVH